MNKLFVAIFALILAGEYATAADFPLNGNTQPACCNDWAGFYLGLHGGNGWNHDDFSIVVSTTLPNSPHMGGINSKGSLWGGQAGYIFQFNKWVVGLEIDVSATKIHGDSTPVATIQGQILTTWTLSDEQEYLGTVRARLGFTPLSGWLFYATAGLAFERVNQGYNVTQVAPLNQVIPLNIASTNTVSPTNWFGWVAGFGTETKLFSSNWIARIEYLHYDFGSTRPATSATAGGLGNAFYSENLGRQTIDVVRAAVSYRFCNCDNVPTTY